MSTSDLTDETLAEWEAGSDIYLPEYADKMMSFADEVCDDFRDARILLLIAEVRRLQEIGDHTSCGEAYTALVAKVDATEAERDEAREYAAEQLARADFLAREDGWPQATRAEGEVQRLRDEITALADLVATHDLANPVLLAMLRALLGGVDDVR